jgi:hypothetical protein
MYHSLGMTQGKGIGFNQVMKELSRKDFCIHATFNFSVGSKLQGSSKIIFFSAVKE